MTLHRDEYVLDPNTVALAPGRIRTPRLELVQATAAILRADLAGTAELGAALDARVPASGWPPGEWDADAVRWMLRVMAETPELGPWGAWYYLRREDRLLVGAGGYKGPPDATGTVEIGYSVVESVQRRGYASEAALGLVTQAFADPGVARVAAETLPHLEASLGVMRKLGFRPADDPSEPGVVRLAIVR